MGITFRMDPHWHLYWNGQSDTGGPINFVIKVPEGFATDAAQWPAPERQELPGDILNHIYENEVTLIVPVRVPSNASGSVEFSAALDWLVCEDACIAEKAKVTLSVPISKDATSLPGPDAGFFTRARAKIGKTLPTAASISVEGLRAEAVIPGATELVFYPGPECSPIPNLLKEGKAAGEAMKLTLEPGEGAAARLAGVLEVHSGKGTAPAYYQVDSFSRKNHGERK